MYLKHAFLRYLKRFGTAEKIIENNNVFNACILAVSETIWNCRKKDENMKTRTLTRAI